MAKASKKGSEIKDKKQTALLFLFPVSVFLILLVIASAASVYFDLQKSDNFIVLLFMLAIGSFISGCFSGKVKRRNGMTTGIIYVIPSVLLLVLISLILNTFSFDINILISALISVISSATGGIVGVNMRQKVKRVKK